MSAFAVMCDFGNEPVQSDVFARVMQRLEHRGPDGSSFNISGNVAMGHWHFWTTPEDVGVRQPLELDNPPCKIVADGRLDNRPELISLLRLDPGNGRLFSDAELILHAYACWGVNCVNYLIGEFVFVIYDEYQRKLFSARDHLGDRTLYYSQFGSCFVFASEPWAVSGTASSNIELDDIALAHYFSFKIPKDGRTLFKGIFELLPAHRIIVSESGSTLEHYWTPDPSKRIRYKADWEYAEHFLSLLDEGVRCRLRSNTPIGVQMSGGLDSTSVACLAAQAMAPDDLHAISYTFDELTSCDERYYINSVLSGRNINSTQFNGDDFWPYKDWVNWPFSPNYPEMMPYRLLLREVCSKAHQEGIRVLLTGSFGDYLYQGGRRFWLAELIADHRMFDATEELKELIRDPGPKQMWREGYIQQAIIRLAQVPFRHQPGRNSRPSWLTTYAADLLYDWEDTILDPVFSHRAGVGTLGLLAARISTHEIPYAGSFSVELRHPYRDRRLVEFVLSLPAYQLFYNGLPKFILRNAMKDILPETVRTRHQPTSLVPLYNEGAAREGRVFDYIYKKEMPLWRRFVDSDKLLQAWHDHTLYENSPEGLLPWLCITIEKWFVNVMDLQGVVA